MGEMDRTGDSPAVRSVGDLRPHCDCHAALMTKRNDRASGWRCSIRHQEAQVNYYRSTKGFRTEAKYKQRREQDASEA